MLPATFSQSLPGVACQTIAARELKAARIAVIGAGNSGRALAAYLSSQGHAVSLIARDKTTLPGIAGSLTVRASGQIEGCFQLSLVESNVPAVLSQMLAKQDVIFVATHTTAYAEVAAQLAPHLHAGQKIVLFSGKLGGALLFAKAVASAGGPPVTVLETDAIFACRTQADESIWVRGFKRWTLYSSTTSSLTTEEGALITRFFPALEPATNIVERGLTDFGALAHAPVVLANMNAIDRQEPFLFYHQGLTPRTVKILERIEEEFNRVADAYGAELIPMKELLNRYYGCDTSSLLEAMQSVPNYKHSQSPPSLDHRFLVEDVAATLVPLTQLARLAKVATPVVDSVITIAGVITGIDFASTGRSLSSFGFAGMTYREVYEAINA